MISSHELHPQLHRDRKMTRQARSHNNRRRSKQRPVGKAVLFQIQFQVSSVCRSLPQPARFSFRFFSDTSVESACHHSSLRSIVQALAISSRNTEPVDPCYRIDATRRYEFFHLMGSEQLLSFVVVIAAIDDGSRPRATTEFIPDAGIDSWKHDELALCSTTFVRVSYVALFAALHD